MTIPIDNLYYLLSYAWRRAKPNGVSGHGTVDFDAAGNILAYLLHGAISNILKRGLERNYITLPIISRSPKGKIDLGQTIGGGHIRQNRIAHEVDELSEDTPANRVLSSTVRTMIGDQSIKSKTRRDLRKIGGRFDKVSHEPISSRLFSKAVIHPGNRYYRMALGICRLYFDACLSTEDGGSRSIADFIRGEQFWKVFQDFLSGFYQIESSYSVTAPKILWQSLSGPDASLVPDMETDLVLKNSANTFILDAKYYKETLVSKYGGPKRFHSGCLYQICTYLQNYVDGDHPNRRPHGMLVFPQIKDELRAEINYRDFKIFVATVDLSKPWPEIHQRLLDLVSVEEHVAGNSSLE